jgi:hypothetical protein
MNDRDRRFSDREQARAYLIEKIEAERRLLADPRGFSTFDPNWIIEDAEFRLRWLDCAPAGAKFCGAPLQDKHGVPCGGNSNENVGPNQTIRAWRANKGFTPYATGQH